MQKIKRLQNSSGMSKPSKNDHDMKPLMTCAENVKRPFKPSFRKLRFSSAAIQNRSSTNLEGTIHALTAYANAPVAFKPRVVRTHFSPIRWLCKSQPYFTIPCTTGIIDEKARLPNVAALSGRRNGSLKRGWNVNTEHAIASAKDWEKKSY